MRKLVLLFLIILPGICGAQEYMSGHLAENRIDDATGDTIKRSYWQVLERAGLNKKLNTFFRISRINRNIFLDIKAIEGGEVFVVPRNAELKLLIEDGSIIILHNSAYQVSCKGCGARGYAGSSAQGTMLTYPLSSFDIRTLLRNYVMRIGIITGEDYLEKKITQTHSQLLMDELSMLYYAR